MQQETILNWKDLLTQFEISTDGSNSYEELQRIVRTVLRREICDNTNHVSIRQLALLAKNASPSGTFVAHTSINRWKQEIKDEITHCLQHPPTASFADIVVASAQVTSSKPPHRRDRGASTGGRRSRLVLSMRPVMHTS
jgi:hypothetical protein